MSMILCVAGAVLMILGAAELARLAVFWATRPIDGEKMSLVVAPAGAGDCEALVRAAAERARWMGGGCGLVCVLAEETPELLSICRFLRLQYPYLRVCKKGDLVYDIIEGQPGKEAGG